MILETATGVTLAYDDVGAAELTTRVLVHGYASNRRGGWQRTGWYAALDARRERRIAIDLRGHGESLRSHDPADYDLSAMAADIIAVLDHLVVARASLVGFSLGARVALACALDHPGRFEHLVLGGVGMRLFDPPGDMGAMAQAMRTEDVETIAQPLLRSFRQFADAQGEDRLALAACSEGRGRTFVPDDLMQLRVPTLVVAGARDLLAGSPEGLAEAIPGALAATLPGCDHFGTITHALFKGRVFDFFDGWLDVDDPPGFR
jgi:pimeloyl-ACP methyl ester carboxylesterase